MYMRKVFQHLLNPPRARRDGKVIQIKTLQDCQSLFEADFAILFKYSATCSYSIQKLRATLQFFSTHPAVPIHTLSVQAAPAASMLVEEQTGIRHETPQVIGLQKGTVVAHGSHGRLSENFLVELAAAVAGNSS